MLTRRGLLRAALAAPLLRPLRQDPQPALPPVRAITRGPKFHWFGYPDAEGLQHPYEVASERIVPLGHSRSPAVYRGESRCDTHPRSSRDGKRVIIDSPHAGGRQLYSIDVSAVT